MKHRIEGAGSEPVAVASQFLDHPQTIDFVFRRVVQHMKPEKAG